MNAVLDRAADPREMVDYSYVQLRNCWPRCAAARQGSPPPADGRNCGSATCNRPRAGWAALAEQAVRAGEDDLARQALARRTAMLAQVSQLREQQATLRAEEEKMTGAGRRLQEKIDEFAVRKEAIKAAYTGHGPRPASPRSSPGSPRGRGRRRRGRPPCRGRRS
jgi:phage shock protein A